MTLPKKNRMSRSDFAKRFRAGNRLRGAYCSLRYGPSSDDEARVAVVVPAKLTPRAVQRNRIRRILTGYLESVLPAFKRPMFVVITVHARLTDQDIERCRTEVADMLVKSGIIVS